MKQIFAILLSITLIMGLSSCGATDDEPKPPASSVGGSVSSALKTPAPHDEYQRAIWYCYADSSSEPDSAVTEKQIADMLSGMLAKVDEPACREWRRMTAAASESQLVFRDYGALMLLAAAELIDYTDFNHRGMSVPYQPQNIDWNSFFEATGEYPLFSDLAESCCASIGGQLNSLDMNYSTAAMTFVYSRFSLAGGASLFDWDENHLTRNSERMTYREAALAVVRLYESERAAVEQLPEEEDSLALAKEILSEADENRLSILSSETEIIKSDRFVPGETYSGNAFYVSNCGDDINDGLSPETAWASVERVNSEPLQYGDAVFFERGGLWRGAFIESKDGVTYSAYGKGEKPSLSGSPENGSGSKKWSLWYEGEQGKKIWLYHQDLPDCGNVVLDGTGGTRKLVGFWNGKEYLYSPSWQFQSNTGMEAKEYFNQPPLDIKSSLSEDLMFFSQADSLLPDTLPIYTFGWIVGDQDLLSISMGPLYLRCDAGNPGELYKSIEFVNRSGPFDGLRSECTVDNLSIVYFNDGILSLSEGSGSVVQNCEAGWCGGYISAYSSDSITGYPAGASRSSGGIGASCVSDIKIRDNYIHDLYHAGTGAEIFVEQNDVIRGAENILISGNVIYRCGTGLNYFNWDEEENPNHMFKNIVFADNFVLFCGMADWLEDRNSVGIGIDGGPNLQEGCAFRNNAFFGAADTLVYINTYVPETLPDFEGNRYLQCGTGGYLWANRENYYSSLEAEAVVQNILKDETGRFGMLLHNNWNTLNW